MGLSHRHGFGGLPTNGFAIGPIGPRNLVFRRQCSRKGASSGGLHVEGDAPERERPGRTVLPPSRRARGAERRIRERNRVTAQYGGLFLGQRRLAGPHPALSRAAWFVASAWFHINRWRVRLAPPAQDEVVATMLAGWRALLHTHQDTAGVLAVLGAGSGASAGYTPAQPGE